jgi:hypothetical protein
MIIVDEIREQIGVMLHPSKEIRARSVKGALMYYFAVSAVSLVLALVLTFAFGGAAVAGNAGLILAAAVVAIYWILFPISLLFTAGVLQLLGANAFKKFKGKYSDTLSAVIYAGSAVMLFYWLTALPYVWVAVMALAVWDIVIEVVGIAKLHGTSRTAAFGVIVGGWIVVAAIIAAFLLAMFGLGFFSGATQLGVLGGATQLSNFCIAAAGYSCSGVAYSGSALAFNFAQNTGANWTGWEAAYVPANTSTTASGIPNVAFVPMGRLASGQSEQVSLPAQAQYGKLSGTVWVCYTTQGAGISGSCIPTGGVASAQVEYAQVAALTAKTS